MTQEQSILSKIKTMFSAETILLQNRIDTYFPKHKLAIEIDELPPGDRNIDKEVSRRKAIKKELDCEFNRINPAKEKFDVFAEISKIQNFFVGANKKLTEESTKKILIDEISNKLLGLEFKSNNFIKTKCLKYVVKSILPNL